MRLFFKKKFIVLCLTLACTLPNYTLASDIKYQPMNLYVGQSEFIGDKTITNVAVGSNEILNAVAIDNKGVLITGVKSGDTTIKVWRSNSLQTINTHVYPANLMKMVHDIKIFMEDYDNTSVRILGDRIVVDGDNLDKKDKAKIDAFLSQFDYVTNLTSARVLDPDINDQRMIYFDVKILEVSRNNMGNLGIEWDTKIDGMKVGVVGEFKKSSAYYGDPSIYGIQGAPTGAKISPFASYAGIVSSITSRINLMQSQGLARLVAHPVLSCKNGGTASFLSGGQVPYNTASATGTPSVEFKDYGIKLNVSPIIQADGSIVAKITAEVSEIDSSVVVDNVPGLLTRKTETEFSLKNAETLVVSGLNSTQESDSHAKVPGVSKLPVLGGLFKNTSTIDKQTELLFVVTPIIYSEDNSVVKDAINTSDNVIKEMNQNNILLPKDFFFSEENRIYFHNEGEND